MLKRINLFIKQINEFNLQLNYIQEILYNLCRSLKPLDFLLLKI